MSFDEYKGILLVLLLVFGMRAFSAKKAVAVIFAGLVTSSISLYLQGPSLLSVQYYSCWFFQRPCL